MDTIFAQKMSLNSLGQRCLECDMNMCRPLQPLPPSGITALAQPQDPRMLHISPGSLDRAHSWP